MEMIPSPQLGFLRGVLPANLLESADDWTTSIQTRAWTDRIVADMGMGWVYLGSKYFSF